MRRLLFDPLDTVLSPADHFRFMVLERLAQDRQYHPPAGNQLDGGLFPNPEIIGAQPADRLHDFLVFDRAERAFVERG
jgi:hypothetical protein